MKLTPVDELPESTVGKTHKFTWLKTFHRLETEFPGQWVKIGRKYKNRGSMTAAAFQIRNKYCVNGHANIDVTVRAGALYMRARRKVGRPRKQD